MSNSLMGRCHSMTKAGQAPPSRYGTFGVSHLPTAVPSTLDKRNHAEIGTRASMARRNHLSPTRACHSAKAAAIRRTRCGRCADRSLISVGSDRKL